MTALVKGSSEASEAINSFKTCNHILKKKGTARRIIGVQSLSQKNLSLATYPNYVILLILGEQKEIK